MIEISYFLTFFLGIVLGILFFGGLWLTVKNSLSSKSPALWFLMSFIFRTAITMIGFYYCASGNWQRLLTCLLGFIVARYIINHFIILNEENQAAFKKEINETEP